MFFGVRRTVLVVFLIPLARNNKLLNVAAVGFSSWSERETDQWLRIERKFLVPKHYKKKISLCTYMHTYISPSRTSGAL